MRTRSGPDREANHARRARVSLRRAQRHAADVHAAIAEHARPHEIRDAEEVGDEGRLRMLVDVTRRAELLHPAARHHGEPVGHRQRLLLVVRHVEERDADLALDALQLDLELPAQLRVERAERLVEQEHGRREHESPRERHALLLAARELVRPALPEAAQPDELERLGDPAASLVPRDVLEAKAEADVLLDGEVREQRVALEDRVHRREGAAESA